MLRVLSYLFALLCIVFTSCDREKNVDVQLPKFQSQLMVESYLQPGSPVQLALTQTQDFFATPDINNVFIQNAKVVLSYSDYPGRKDTLQQNDQPEFNPQDSTLKFFNYISKANLPALHPGSTVFINAVDPSGRSVTAQTTWIDPVKIDTIKEQIYSNKRVGLLVYFTDNPAPNDHYRFRVRKLAQKDTVKEDFFDTDNIFNGKQTYYDTGPSFFQKDTLEVTLYHITDEYFNYLLTADQASQSNGNPFAVPATITSNVKGGTGIFTVLPFSRKVIVVR
jgi:hypothetical protein